MSAATQFKYRVKILDGTPTLKPTYNALLWLESKDLEAWIDYDIDLHAGRLGYTSFWFHNKELALEFALVNL